jgi:putative toxin-antitoxin system antitoxin component (TIGR02293 family)
MATALQIEGFGRVIAPEHVRVVEAGLPVKMLRVIMRDYGFTVGDLAKVVAPRRTLDRRLKAGERLTVEESDRLARLMRLLDIATDIFKNKDWVHDWLVRAKPVLGNRVPLDLIATDAGGRLVEEELLQIKYGFFA